MGCFLNEASVGGAGPGDDPGGLRDDRAVIFPPDQASAARTYVTGILRYPSFYEAKTGQHRGHGACPGLYPARAGGL
jgi:hypothetical protein